jgi:hypothetical protein
MIDLLWWLSAPFWQKMFFITNLAGLCILFVFILGLFEHSKTKLKNLKIKVKEEFEKEKARRNEFIHERFGKK